MDDFPEEIKDDVEDGLADVSADPEFGRFRATQERRWSPRLVRGGWSAVPTLFFRNYHRLGISPTQAMLLLHIFSYRWTEAAPFPAVTRLAKEMGLSAVQVRAHLRQLEKRGLIERQRRSGASSLLQVEGLLIALDDLQREDEKANREATREKHAELRLKQQRAISI